MPALHSHASMITHWGGRFAVAEALVVCRGDIPLGFAVVEDHGLDALYVARDARNGGLGKALLEAARRDRDHLRLWTFQANTAARRFYHRAGFFEIARTEGDNEEGLPDVQLEWRRPTGPLPSNPAT